MGLSLPKSNLIFLKKCLDKWVHFNSSSSSQEIGQKQIRTFNGTSKVKASDGHTWTPPAGSHQDKDGYIIDKDGCVIGQTGPLKIPSDAVG